MLPKNSAEGVDGLSWAILGRYCKSMKMVADRLRFEADRSQLCVFCGRHGNSLCFILNLHHNPVVFQLDRVGANWPW